MLSIAVLGQETVKRARPATSNAVLYVAKLLSSHGMRVIKHDESQCFMVWDAYNDPGCRNKGKWVDCTNWTIRQAYDFLGY